MKNSLDSMRHDWNKELNKVRAQMNKEIRTKCFELSERNRAQGGDADGS